MHPFVVPERGRAPTFSKMHVVHSVSLFKRPSSANLFIAISLADASVAR